MTAVDRTWARCQIFVPAPIVAPASTSADGWTNTESGSAGVSVMVTHNAMARVDIGWSTIWRRHPSTSRGARALLPDQPGRHHLDLHRPARPAARARPGFGHADPGEQHGDGVGRRA